MLEWDEFDNCHVARLVHKDAATYLPKEAPKIIKDYHVPRTGIILSFARKWAKGHPRPLCEAVFDKNRWTREKAEAWMEAYRAEYMDGEHDRDKKLPRCVMITDGEQGDLIAIFPRGESSVANAWRQLGDTRRGAPVYRPAAQK